MARTITRRLHSVGMRVVVAALLGFSAFGLVAVAPAPAAAELHIVVGLRDLNDNRREPLERMVRDAEREVSATLRSRLDGTLRVDFAGSGAAFSALVEEAGAGSRWSEPWIAGLALLDKERVLVRLDGPGLLHTSETVRHELAHVAVHALAHGRWLPRWYHESVAMLVAGEATAERLRDVVGGTTVTDLATLEQAFSGHRLDASRAYATAAGFLRFALRRTNNPAALAELHERLHLGLDFEPAFVATFGLPPGDLFALYRAFLDSSGSGWAMLLGDSAVWSVVSLLFILSLAIGWRRRPRFGDGEPMDLEAIAAAGALAIRTGRFVPPLEEGGAELVRAARIADAAALPTDPQGAGASRHHGQGDVDRGVAGDVSAAEASIETSEGAPQAPSFASTVGSPWARRRSLRGGVAGAVYDDELDDDDDDFVGPPPSLALPRAASPQRLRRVFRSR